MTQTDQLMPALVKALGEIEQPKKTSTNPHFKSKFADLAACMDAVREPLRKNGLAVIQTLDTAEGADLLVTRLVHVSGQSIESRARLLLSKQDAQGVGSAVTYMRRYSLCAMLGLVADPDDDGNAASKKSADKAEAPAAPSYLGELASALEAAKTGADIDAIEKTFSAKPLTFAMRRQVTELLQKARTKVQ